MKRHYCTLFNRNYFARFSVMYDSLMKHDDDFVIYTFCMDDEAYQSVLEMGKENIKPISLQELERFDKDLLNIKTTRSIVEYYFTCTPVICNYVIENYSEVEAITYLDSDLYFFSSPELIFKEIIGKSVAIVEHRSKSIKNGIYNVAWITFQRDKVGLQCLKKYRLDCLDWCYAYHDNGRYADQKYLDNWPQEYDNVAVIKNKGVNLAPWNIFRYKISVNQGNIMVDDDALVFYHFSGIEMIHENLYTTRICAAHIRPAAIVKYDIYKPYLIALKKKSVAVGAVSKVEHIEYNMSFVKNMMKRLYRKSRRFLFNDYVKLN